MRHLIVSVLLFVTAAYVNIKAQETIVVNEVMVGNIDMMIDPSFNYGGWIEIYNPTSASVSMNNMYISDERDNLRKFRLASNIGSVASKGFKTLWFDHYSTGNEYSTESGKQVGFKLNADGGTIYLSNSSGQLILTQAYPPAVSRVSFARTADGGPEWRFTSTPTQGATNVGSTFADEQLPPPLVDRGGTVYTMPFQVQVAIPDGATLRYTTDGTTPTLTNGETSADGLFRVEDGNYVFRFRLFQDGWLPSAVVTRTYIYNDKGYYLPIVSVVTDRKNLYDNRIGAYVDGTNGIGGNGGNGNQSSNKNRSWERPVNFEYLVPDSMSEYSVALDQETDFEVSGGWSRHFKPAASFKLKAAKVYEGMNYLDYPIFESKPYIKNKAIIVRNGGNDCNCRIYDAAIHEILRSSGFYIDCQAWQPAHIFINGQYQFMFNLRETNNKNFAYSNYGIDKDDMDQFEFSGGYKQMVGDDVAYQKWLSLTTQLANQPNNDDIWQQICNLVDIDEYCNYMAAECYVGCNDWVTNSNNVKGFRSRNDGRFHLVFMDLDQGFTNDNMLNSMKINTWGWGSTNSLIQLFVNMLQREEFKRKFIDTYCIVAGSIFDAERSKQIITDMANYIEPALAMDGKSPWRIVGQSGSNTSLSGNSLMTAITDNSRRNARVNALRSYFSLSKSYNVTIGSNLPQADIMVNGVKIPTGHFDGTLFAPVQLTTSAPAGYRFKGWKGSGGIANLTTLFNTNTTWSYYDKGSLDNTNWQSADYDATNWSSGTAPFGYGTIKGVSGSTDIKTTLDYGTNSSNKRPTSYFRRKFVLGKTPTDNQVVQLNYYVDDGCVIYINGQEVTRYLMPEGKITYSQYSTTYVGSEAYAGQIIIDNSLLHSGTNTIAVEVHNTSATSSDFYWTASLTIGTLTDGVTTEELDFDNLSTTTHYDIEAIYEPVADESIVHQGSALFIEDNNEPFAPIRINEVSAGNTVYVNEYFKKNDWIELYNTTDMTIDVAGLYLSDNINKPQKYQIPSSRPGLNTLIPAGGHLVVWADKLEPLERSLAATTNYRNLMNLHTLFKLGNEDGQMVILSSSAEFVANNPAYFEAHPTLADGFADQLVYNAHDGDQSVGRYPDGGNNLYVMARPTIGETNAQHIFDRYIGTDEGIQADLNHADGIQLAHTDRSQTAGLSITGIYTTSGVFVGTDTDRLKPGLYIITQSDGRNKKVMLR